MRTITRTVAEPCGPPRRWAHLTRQVLEEQAAQLQAWIDAARRLLDALRALEDAGANAAESSLRR